MKIFLKQALLLGGTYLIISTALSLIGNNLLADIDMVLFVILILSVLFLAYKKNYRLLAAWAEKYQKTAVYLMAFGVVEYVSVVMFVPVVFLDVYKRSLATGVEYVSPFAGYLEWASIFILIMFVASLIVATYVNFVRPKLKPKN